MKDLLEKFLGLEGDPLTMRGFLLVLAQGSVVLGVGAGLVARSFVKSGFRFR